MQRLNIIDVGSMPPRLGGSALLNYWIVKELSKRHDIRVITETALDDLIKQELSHKDQDEDFKILRKIITYLPSTEIPDPAYWAHRTHAMNSELQEQIKERRPDIIVLGHETFQLVVKDTVKNVCKKQKIPVVTIVNGALTPRIMDKKFNKMRKRILSAYKLTDVFIPISNALEEDLHKLGFYNTKVIEPPIDMRKFRLGKPSQQLKKKLGIPEGSFAVMHASNFAQVKRVQDLVEAAALLPKKGFYFIIIGEGEQKKSMQGLIEEKALGKMFFFTGRVAQEDMPKYLRLANAFVLCSEAEAFGLVIRESQACGVPVISSKTTGAEEQIVHRETGLVYKVGDVKALARQIQNLKKGLGLRMHIKSKALKHVKQEYSHRSVAAEYEKVFYSILKE